MIKSIFYSTGFKYQLRRDYSIQTTVVGFSVNLDFLILGSDGMLTMKKGYAWDGPSGPTIDTRNFIRASLVHDALYQLMRGAFIPATKFRKQADVMLYTLCRDDGMSWLRAKYVYLAVRHFGAPAADVNKIKETLMAP